MANESDVRQRVGKYLREHGFFVQPMETGATADGVPDLWYTRWDCDGWLEIKKIRILPVRKDTALFASMNHPLGVYQANWINRCIEFGTRVDILVAYERRYFFVPGSMADSFNSLTWDAIQVFEIKKEKIIEKLTGHK